MAENDPLSEKVIGLAIDVHKTLGPGLLETVYEQYLCHELKENVVQFERQVAVPITYKAANLECGFRADVIVEKTLLVEIKALERLLPVHQAQVLTYLKLSGIGRGLLINFNTKLLKNGIQRYVF